MNLIPIQITLQAANAADAKQLVLDLAGTLATMNPADIPARTEVSTVPAASQYAVQAAPALATVPTGVPTYQQGPANPGYAPAQPMAQQSPEQMSMQPDPYSGSPATQPGMVPTTAQTYTMQQLAVAATQLMDAGRRADVVSLLSSFGVEALTTLPKEAYGAFATQLRALGAQI